MNHVKRFTKKPVTIEAIQFAYDPDTIRNIHGFMGASEAVRLVHNPMEPGPVLEIPTLEGVMKAQVGDWIIKGVKGGFYPCKPDIFEATYEPAKPTLGDDWKSRLLAETQETAGRLNKLNAFMGSDAFPPMDRADKDLLYEQQRTMSRLVQILGQRLELHAMPFEHPKP